VIDRIAHVTPGPGLDPSPDDAHDWLRDELLKPEYQDRNIIGRVIDWFARQFDSGVNAASVSPLLTTLAAVAIFVLLVAGIGWLAARTRRTSLATGAGGAVIDDSRIGAAEYRRRAESALANGDFAGAVIDGFRALARDQIDQGQIEDLPQATARELGVLLARRHPVAADPLMSAAQLFDAVLYGDRPASRQQAHDVLGLDQLVRVRR
jgi:Domain of unknown function (DUF4129)